MLCNFWWGPNLKIKDVLGKSCQSIQQAKEGWPWQTFTNRILSSSNPFLTCAIFVAWNSLETETSFCKIFSGWRELRHPCSIFRSGRLRDAGKYAGLALSMRAFPAWFLRMNGTWQFSIAHCSYIRLKIFPINHESYFYGVVCLPNHLVRWISNKKNVIHSVWGFSNQPNVVTKD